MKTSSATWKRSRPSPPTSAPAEPDPAAERATLLYDADCGLCRYLAAKVLAWDRDRRLRPVALQDPAAERLLVEKTGEERMSSWHLVRPDGSVSSAGDAFPPLLRMLPGGGPLARASELAAPVVGAGYRVVAGHRSFFGRFVPDAAKRRADARIRERADG